MTHDKQGRPWAKLSELKPGDTIELDAGFSCAHLGPREIVKDARGFYFICAQGSHYLDGQADDGEHCVGVYGPIR